MPSTIRLHRIVRTSPERVYRDFTDAGSLVKWLPPNGYTGTMHRFDAKVGGGYRMSFTSIASGNSHAFEVVYRELAPGRRIVHTDRFDDPGLPGEMTVTIELAKVAGGTELNIVQEGVPDVIPWDACYVGWQQSLTLLALLVEAEPAE